MSVLQATSQRELNVVITPDLQQSPRLLVRPGHLSAQVDHEKVG